MISLLESSVLDTPSLYLTASFTPFSFLHVSMSLTHSLNIYPLSLSLSVTLSFSPFLSLYLSHSLSISLSFSPSSPPPPPPSETLASDASLYVVNDAVMNSTCSSSHEVSEEPYDWFFQNNGSNKNRSITTKYNGFLKIMILSIVMIFFLIFFPFETGIGSSKFSKLNYCI